jgi:hypothetical protein
VAEDGGPPRLADGPVTTATGTQISGNGRALLFASEVAPHHRGPGQQHHGDPERNGLPRPGDDRREQLEQRR